MKINIKGPFDLQEKFQNDAMTYIYLTKALNSFYLNIKFIIIYNKNDVFHNFW